jgi:uncharacterized protein (TIGR02246 family)
VPTAGQLPKNVSEHNPLSTKSAGILGGCIILAALLLVFVPRLLPGSAPAQPANPGQGAVLPTRQELLAKQLDASYKTFVANDAKGHAAVYAPDGDFIETTGEVFRGREAVEKFFANIFSRTKVTPMQLQFDSQRYVTPEVLVVAATSPSLPGRTEGQPRAATRPSGPTVTDNGLLCATDPGFQPNKPGREHHGSPVLTSASGGPALG